MFWEGTERAARAARVRVRRWARWVTSRRKRATSNEVGGSGEGERHLAAPSG